MKVGRGGVRFVRLHLRYVHIRLYRVCVLIFSIGVVNLTTRTRPSGHVVVVQGRSRAGATLFFTGGANGYFLYRGISLFVSGYRSSISTYLTSVHVQGNRYVLFFSILQRYRTLFGYTTIKIINAKGRRARLPNGVHPTIFYLRLCSAIFFLFRRDRHYQRYLFLVYVCVYSTAGCTWGYRTCRGRATSYLSGFRGLLLPWVFFAISYRL